MVTRQDSINWGLTHNRSIDEIDKALNKLGYKGLSIYEKQRLQMGQSLGGNELQRLGESALADVKEIATGIKTLGAMGGRMITDPGFRDYASKQVGKYLSDKGPAGVITDVYDAIIGEPFNLQPNTGVTPLNVIPRVVAGARNNPLEALQFIAPIYKALPEGAKVGNVLEKVSEASPVAEYGIRPLRQFIPSSNVAKVSKAIDTAKSHLTTSAMKLEEDATRLFNQQGVTAGEVIKNLQTGNWTGTKETLNATKSFRDDIAKKYNKILEELGADAKASERTAITQYIQESINPGRTNPYQYFGNIERALAGDTIALREVGVPQERLIKLSREGKRLYDEGKIYPVSHRESFVKPGEAGKVGTADFANQGLLTPRGYGWASPEELVETVPKAYAELMGEAGRQLSGRLAVSDVAVNLGKPINFSDVKNIRPDEIVISPNAFNDILRSDFARGLRGTTGEWAKKFFNEGMTDDLMAKYQDNLYVIKKEYLKPIINATNETKVPKFLGALDSNWKYVALETPGYFMQNRIGNVLNNTLEGVVPKDYVDVGKVLYGGEEIAKGKYFDLLPERLRFETSYSGLLGEQYVGKGTITAVQQGVKETSEAIKNKDIMGALLGTNKTLGGFVFPMEARFEFLDRSANFVRQAKRYANSHNMTVEQVLRRANSDSRLYNELNANVKKSLGDYTGRNWAINPMVYQVLSKSFPFFKFPTQSVRTIARQMADRPISYQLLVNAPAQIGEELWREQLSTLPQGYGEDKLGGLYTERPQGRFAPGVLQQFNANPMSAGAELIYNIFKNPSAINVSPIYSLANAIKFKDAYGNFASSPRYVNYGNQTYEIGPDGRPTGRIVNEPTLSDVASNIASTLGNMYLAPIGIYNRVVGPAIAGVRGIPWYSRYSTSLLGQQGDNRTKANFLVGGSTLKRGQRGMDETFWNKIFGITTSQDYPRIDTASSRQMRGTLKKIQRMKLYNKQKGKR